MSIQHHNAARIISLATQLGIKLPKEIAAAASHLEEIRAASTGRPNAGLASREIASLLGKPAAFAKAREEAAAALATAEAMAKIDGFLTDACGSRLFLLMRRDRELVTTAIGEGLASALATLQATAGQLPEWFRAEHAADLSPELFEVWTKARDACARIESTRPGLAELYAGSTTGHETHFTPVSAATLRYANPAKIQTRADGYAARDALLGRAERRQGMAGQGSTFVEGIFIPTALARAGFTFEWATPSGVTERAQHITNVLAPTAVSSPAPTRVGRALKDAGPRGRWLGPQRPEKSGGRRSGPQGGAHD